MNPSVGYRYGLDFLNGCWGQFEQTTACTHLAERIPVWVFALSSSFNCFTGDVKLTFSGIFDERFLQLRSHLSVVFAA